MSNELQQASRISPSDAQLRLAFNLFSYEREIFAARAALTTAEQLLLRAKETYFAKVLAAYGKPRGVDISQLEFTADACGSKLIRLCVRNISVNATGVCIFCGSVGNGNRSSSSKKTFSLTHDSA